MADIEKVIKGLEFCISTNVCKGCPYEDPCHDIEQRILGEAIMRDALELMKEQQPKKVAYDINGLTGLPVSFCPSCGEGVNMYAYGRNDLKQVFCPYCGQALDWKDGEQK